MKSKSHKTKNAIKESCHFRGSPLTIHHRLLMSLISQCFPHPLLSVISPCSQRRKLSPRCLVRRRRRSLFRLIQFLFKFSAKFNPKLNSPPVFGNKHKLFCHGYLSSNSSNYPKTSTVPPSSPLLAAAATTTAVEPPYPRRG